ncbi:MAG: PilN domain-containing protein [Nitrospirae bacterium]|nr:PilN domain-containing protein [Nitrospirota bacterium]MBI5696309.1 PilN domain-containing protein [Nitrospirota bacterium]
MIRINLLPHKKVKPVEKGVQRLWMILTVLSAVSVFGMAAAYFMLYSKSSDLQERTDKANTELTALKAKVTEVEGYEKSRLEYENKLALIADLQKKRAFLTPFINELNKSMIKTVWMTGLTEKDGEFTVQAMCKESRAAADEFGNALKRSPLLTNVEVKDVKDVPSGSPGISAYSFLVTGKIAGIESLPPPPAPEKAAKGKAAQGKGKKKKKK